MPGRCVEVLYASRWRALAVMRTARQTAWSTLSWEAQRWQCHSCQDSVFSSTHINFNIIIIYSLNRNKSDNQLYRVAQNKPDYLLLLFKFCITITKHVSMIMYVQHQNTSQSSAQCVLHRLQQRATIVCESVLYSAIDNVLTNLLPAGLLDFFQFHQFF